MNESEISKKFLKNKKKQKTHVLFGVSLEFVRLENIPLKNAKIFLEWNIGKKLRGNTKTKRIEGNQVSWNEVVDFHLALKIQSKKHHESSLAQKILRVKIMESRRGKSDTLIESLDIDLSRVLTAVQGKITRSFLLKKSKFNSSLRLGFDYNLIFGNPLIFSRSKKSDGASSASMVGMPEEETLDVARAYVAPDSTMDDFYHKVIKESRLSDREIQEIIESIKSP